MIHCKSPRCQIIQDPWTINFPDLIKSPTFIFYVKTNGVSFKNQAFKKQNYR